MSDATQSISSSPDSAALDARNRLVIGLLLVSTFVVILNETIMGVAIPHLMRDLSIPASAAQWLTTAFMLTMAVVIPITGLMLQRFNTRPMFIAAMGLFSLGTLIAAVSPGFSLLLVARVVQASGTAIMFPLLMTTLMNLVPPAARGRTMGNISIVISVAPAIGPTISGLILSVLSWRWMFVLVLPIALAALIAGAVRVRNVTTPVSTRFDVVSIILSAFGFGGLVYGLSNLGTATPDTIAVVGWLPIGVGLVALALFILRQFSLQKRDAALLDLRTFRVPTFTFSVVMFTISMMAMFGTAILMPLYLQNVLQLTALDTGLIVLPGGLLMGLLAPFVGRLYDRIGPTALVVAGSVVVSAVFWTMTTLDQNSSPFLALAAYTGLCLGLALLFTPLFTASLGSLPQRLYSHGSAVVGTVQQVAGAAGTALFVTVMSAQIIALQGQGVGRIAATAGGIHLAFLYGAIISLLAIPIAFFVRRPAEHPEYAAEYVDQEPVGQLSSEPSAAL